MLDAGSQKVSLYLGFESLVSEDGDGVGVEKRGLGSKLNSNTRSQWKDHRSSPLIRVWSQRPFAFAAKSSMISESSLVLSSSCSLFGLVSVADIEP